MWKTEYSRRAAALLLCFCLMLPFLPAVPAFAADPELWVNNVNILEWKDSGYTVPCGSGTAVYDPDTNTLTLTDATIDDGVGPNKRSNAIYSNVGDLTIELVGENKIENFLGGIASSDQNPIPGNLIIQGEGKLTVVNNTAGLVEGVVWKVGGALLDECTLSVPSVIVKNGTLKVQNNSDITLEAKKESYSFEGEDIEISDSTVKSRQGYWNSHRTLVIRNSHVNIDDKNENAAAVISSNGKISVCDGSVAVIKGASGNALWSSDSIVIEGEKTEVVAESIGEDESGFVYPPVYADGTISILDGASYTSVESPWISLYGVEGIVLDGATVNVFSQREAGLYSPGSITAKDSSITAKSEGELAAAVKARAGISMQNVQLNLMGIENGLYSASFDEEMKLEKVSGTIQAEYTGIISNGPLSVSGCDLSVKSTKSYAVQGESTFSILDGTRLELTGEESFGALFLPMDDTSPSLSFGDTPWYQWIDTKGGDPVRSTETPYVYDDDAMGNYLLFEPIEKEPEEPEEPEEPSGGGSSGSGDGDSIGAPMPLSGDTWPPNPAAARFVSDTTHDFTMEDVYQFRITSLDGAVPAMTVSGSGFRMELASQEGNDYFFKLYAGTPGTQADVFLNGEKLLTVTAPAKAVSDTTAPFTVKQGESYQFRITAAEPPKFAAGSPSFVVQYAGNERTDWFFKVYAVGKPGDGCGFYLNDASIPVAVAHIS